MANAGERNTGAPIARTARPPILAMSAWAAGGGVLLGLAAAAVAALLAQADATVKVFERTAAQAAALDIAFADGQISSSAEVARSPIPRADGVYLPDGRHLPDGQQLLDGAGAPYPRPRSGSRPLVLVMLGDSTAVGYGTRTAAELPGVLFAVGAAAVLRRPIRLVTLGSPGCGASNLRAQVAHAASWGPDLAIVLVGANDIRDKVPPRRSAHDLGAAVTVLRGSGVPVVVGTCPDFGVIEQIPQPLRTVLHTWSRRLATLQERAVARAGGRSVALGELVSPGFAHHPELFANDHFHPSGPGYARAVAVMLPPVLEELRRSAPEPAAAIRGLG